MEQLIAHVFGDYVLQSDWMAQRKTKAWLPAIAHALAYALCFLILTRSVAALAVIAGTHLIIDHFRLARHVAWFKNFLAPPRSPDLECSSCQPCYVRWWHPWSECSATGYSREQPAWLTVWLMIITDNSIHLLINFLALKYL